jgi:hypothetical protein
MRVVSSSGGMISVLTMSDSSMHELVDHCEFRVKG